MNLTLSQSRIKNNVKHYESLVGLAYREIDDFRKAKHNEILELNKLIRAEQSKCKHVDDGGFFVATCKICGYVS